MNLKEIKELINLMNENSLSELEVEREGMKIRIRKSLSGKFEAITEEPNMQKSVHTLKPDLKKEANLEKKFVAIPAPMVGTFYRTPSPESKPFIEIGQVVDIGQVVCIIEAMKLMNEIKSEVKGKIVEVLIENAGPVEYGQALFMVDTD